MVKKLTAVVLSVVLSMSMLFPASSAFGFLPLAQNEVYAADNNAGFKTPGHYTLEEVIKKFDSQVSGEDMLLYTAFVYRGWRTSSGHWLDAVMVDLHEKFVGAGFTARERTTTGNQGDSVWFQYETGTTNTWNPQYVSLKVVESTTGSALMAVQEAVEEENGSMPEADIEGDGSSLPDEDTAENDGSDTSDNTEGDTEENEDDASEGIVASAQFQSDSLSEDMEVADTPAVYTAVDPREALISKVNFVADCIDPTSMYYPDYVTAEWLVNTLADPTSDAYKKQQAVNQRVHLATNSPFTALTDPAKTPEENIDAGTKVAQVVYCGTVTSNSNSMGIPESELAGKIILADGATSKRTDTRTYAARVGAVASLCNQVDGYNMPIIDDVQWYTNAAKFAGAGSYTANNVIAFNTSKEQFEALKALCEQGDTYLEYCALGTYDLNQPVRCLIVEIQGATKPEERIVVPSHIDEPGACDNASGVAMNLEIALEMKKMIDAGQLARPERTITFIWGDEITMTRNWLNKYKAEFNNIKGSIDLDMVGEDPAKTGGSMLIERTPDPADKAVAPVDTALRYRYGNSSYPGQTSVPSYTEFIRKPDAFSLWSGVSSASSIPMNNYPGFYLNDLYFKAAKYVQKQNPAFEVASNPYEGGSDHSPFITAANTYGAPTPALLTWHFTDYVYHSSCDTLDKLSVQEFHDVGVTSAAVAYQMANGYELEAADMMDHMMEGWKTRIEGERSNTTAHYGWQRANNSSALGTAYKKELKAIGDWSRWYIDAIRSAGKYMIGGTVGKPYQYQLSAAYKEKQEQYIKQIQQETVDALNNVDTVFGETGRPTQVALANLPEPVFVPFGTSAQALISTLPTQVTVEYVGGGTGVANVQWKESSFTATRAGLHRVTGTLTDLAPGVVNWAVVEAVAEVNAYTSAEKPGIVIETPSYDGTRLGVEVTLSVDAKSFDGGELSYQWYANTTGTNKGGKLIEGATDATYTCMTPSTYKTSNYYYVEVTNTQPLATAEKTAMAVGPVVTITTMSKPSSSHDNGGSGGGSTTPTTPTTPATATPATADKPAVVTINADLTKGDAKANTIQIKADAEGAAADVGMSGEALETLAKQNEDVIVKITTGDASYSLPADLAKKAPELAALLEEKGLSMANVDIHVVITPVPTKGINVDGNALAAVDFTVNAVDKTNGKMLGSINNFTVLVERSMTLPEGQTLPAQYAVFRVAETNQFVPHSAIGNTVTIKSRTNSVYAVVATSVDYDDVTDGFWAKPYIELAASKGLVAGMGNNLYEPNRNVTRAEFTQMLVTALDCGTYTGKGAPYSDVTGSAWYYNAVAQAKDLGLIKFATDTFNPQQPITREEMASMVAEALRLGGLAKGNAMADLDTLFTDADQISTAYANDVATVAQAKLMAGMGNGAFEPQGSTTRAQAATVQIKLLETLNYID